MSPMQISPDVPTAVLEEQAVEQRRRLHNRVSKLRDQVRDTVREKLDVQRYASEYAWPAAGVLGLVAIVFGYSAGGIFKHTG